MISSRNHAFEWFRPHGKKFKWTSEQLIEKCLNYYSTEHIKKIFEATTQLYPEIISENQQLSKIFYLERFHALRMSYQMISCDRETFSIDMVPVKIHGTCKHLLVFLGSQSKFSAANDLKFKKCALVLHLALQCLITDNGTLAAFIPNRNQVKSFSVK